MKGTSMTVKKPDHTSRVVKGQELEVEHLTEIAKISPKQARALLQKHGADWRRLKDEAETLKPED
jgi:arsenate reductase-like glutaredoxin family protein